MILVSACGFLAGSSLGTGFTAGGGSGTIPDGATAQWGGGMASTIWGGDGYNVTEWTAGSLHSFTQFGPDGTVFGFDNSVSGETATAAFVSDGVYGVNISTTNSGQRYVVENGSILYSVTGSGAIEINAGTKIFVFDSAGDKFRVTDNGDGKGMTYADYYPNILTNPRSIPDVGTVNIIKQDLVSYTTTQRNAISSPAAGRTIYCSDCTATDSSTGVQQVYNGSTWKNAW